MSSRPTNPSWSPGCALALVSSASGGCGEGGAGRSGAGGTDVADLPAPSPALAAIAAELADVCDGVGFSDPATSAPITTLGAPIVDGLVDKQGPVGVPLRLEGFVTYGVGVWSFAWTLVSVPEGSAITPPWFGGETNNSVVFVPDVAGVYGFEVIVSDEGGQTEPIRFEVTAS